MKKQTGFTWISVLITLVVLGGLVTEGAQHWQAWRMIQGTRVMFYDLTRALAFARTEAFLREETLVLLPSDISHNWALGIQLQSEYHPLFKVHAWQWHVPQGIALTWHGFRGQDKLVVSHAPESLAMNGYFLLEVPKRVSEKWVVNRFGRMRVLRKHVA
ncbi:MAG: hypothetical protein K0U37_00750 [Gammaproteobacteria bacterium]|nr:hypothetical protein [Gammaproteobacteria bacterium]